MKTQTKKNKTPLAIKILLLVTAAILLLITSCKKTQTISTLNNDIMQLTDTENALLGKWQMTENDTYEIDGIDSLGQYICSLISSQKGDSSCRLELEHVYNPQLPDRQLTGKGSVEECNSNKKFLWNARHQNMLEVLFKNSYDIVYLTYDSVAFSRVYTNDILKLKSIIYYKRCK
ncbi:MAG: hypothetical protein ACXVC6_05270 [Bacteroidia bacterium]